MKLGNNYQRLAFKQLEFCSYAGRCKERKFTKKNGETFRVCGSTGNCNSKTRTPVTTRSGNAAIRNKIWVSTKKVF